MTSHIKYRSIGECMRGLLHLSNKEIAAQLGCHPDTVQQNRHRIARGHVFRPRRGPWTDERIDSLKQLWAAGLSASQIARRLGGVTRNAVIGKVTRLGLSGRATTSRKIGNNRRPRMTRPAPAPKPPSPLAELYREPYVPPAEELVIPLNERKIVQTLLDGDCRWPIGDPQHADFHFCGKKKIPGLPYCDVHARRAYQPPQPRQRETFIPRDANVIQARREKESVA